MERYFNVWSSFEEMKNDFGATDVEDKDILLASYDQGGYEGSAYVLFEKDGELLEVSGAHCSCYGLEGQWTPTRVTWKALAMRRDESWGARSHKETNDAFDALVAEHNV